MEDAFDIQHVKDWRCLLMGAYLHRPIVLSLWSWDLLMEYSQDHFSFNALGEKRGGEEDDVLFLSWVSKHGEEDLHAELGSFLFMGVCQTIIED